MRESSNLATVRRFYANLSSPEVLMDVLSPTIQWEITPGFPYGGVYNGTGAVFNDFFGRVLGDFDDWKTEASELLEAGDRVIGRGAYSGRCKSTASDSAHNSSTCGRCKAHRSCGFSNAPTRLESTPRPCRRRRAGLARVHGLLALAAG